MATKRKRYTRRKPIQFNSPELHKHMLVDAYKQQCRWFELVSASERDAFSLKYATKTWNVSPTGNPCSIVISYPRPDGKVLIYDLDSGEKYWVKLSLFTRKRISGRANERMYEYDSVVMDDARCESEDITMNIDWDLLSEWDKQNARKGKPKSEWDKWTGPRIHVDARFRSLVAVPKGVKVAD